jgi:hypothetical protein
MSNHVGKDVVFYQYVYVEWLISKQNLAYRIVH